MQIHAVYDHVFHAAHKACAVGLGKAAGHSHVLKTTYWEEERREMKEKKRKREKSFMEIRKKKKETNRKYTQ